MDNYNSKSLSIAEIVENSELKGSLYSTLRCDICGKKLTASPAGNVLLFMCDSCETTMESKAVKLSLVEIAAILNFNPVL